MQMRKFRWAWSRSELLRRSLWRWSGLRGKTGWDLVAKILIPAMVPVLVGFGVFWLASQQRESELAVATEKVQEDVLRTYFTNISALILEEGLGTANPKSAPRELARAYTSTALRQLDGSRRALVVEFLSESSLIPIVDLAGTDLSGAYLVRVNLHNASLYAASLRGVDLSWACLSNASLSFADLRDANLIRADLTNASLDQADLNGVDLRGAILNGARLDNTNLRGANLSSLAIFPGENMAMPCSGRYSWISLARTDRTDLSPSLIYSTKFGGAYLGGADLTGADLSGAYLGGADLTGANLTGADLSGTYLSGANMTGADLTGANLTGASYLGGGHRGAYLAGANLTEANLTGADLTGVDLTGADLTGADLTKANLRDAKVTTLQLAQTKSIKDAINQDGK